MLGCAPIRIAVIAALKARGNPTVAAGYSTRRRGLAAIRGAHELADLAEAASFRRRATGPAGHGAGRAQSG